MRRFSGIIICILVLLPGFLVFDVEADTEVYNLDLLAGSYTELNPTRADTLTYHGPGGKVTSAFLRIVGTVSNSHFFCPGYTFYYGADLDTDLHNTSTGVLWSGNWENLSGTIDTTTYYYGGGPDTLMLTDGDVIEITMTLEQYETTCALLTVSSVSVQSAILTVNIDTASPVYDRTWGGIKALYSD